MKEFLADNVALSQRLDEFHATPALSSPWLMRASTARMREIVSPAQWASCWLMFASIHCPDQHLRQILAHGCIVLQLAQRHPGSGWLEYDRVFRRQAASDPSIQWNVLNPSLMAATVLATSPGTGSICLHCQAADHRSEECALRSIDPLLEPFPKPVLRTTQPPNPPKTSRPSRYSPYGPGSSREPCRRYNRGICPDTSATCRYRHVCGNMDCLSQSHTLPKCPHNRASKRTSGPPPPRGP